MTANELCRACGFTLLCCPEREITGGVYCCDLLSKAKCPYGLDTPALLARNYEDYKRVLAGEVKV